MVPKIQNLKVRFKINIREKMREKSTKKREGGREGGVGRLEKEERKGAARKREIDKMI
jgi:hypothetical protein